jgi:hypothetical protein
MKPFQITPPSLSDTVLKFCNKISAEISPGYLDTKPDTNAKVLDCFQNVKNHIQKYGGSTQHGWLIWEWPNIMIEAEFHAVWKSEDGVLVDVSPNEYSRVLFLPDNKMLYEGKSVNNIRKAIKNSNAVRKYIKLFDKMFKIMHTGDLAYFLGSMNKTPQMLDIELQQGSATIKVLQEEHGEDWRKILKEHME